LKNKHVLSHLEKKYLATKENPVPQSTFYITMCFSIVASFLGNFRNSKVLGVKYEIGHETPGRTRHNFTNIFMT
jgi:hypothetical protein